MSNLKDHAIKELRLAGYKTGPNQNQNEMNAMMVKDILELIDVFSNQGHSGCSASYCIDLFTTLAKYDIITPLTGEDDEWNDVSEMSGQIMYQNNRCSSVFKDGNGRIYDTNGKVFVQSDGISYTNRDSCVDITFPYTPKTEYITLVKED